MSVPGWFESERIQCISYVGYLCYIDTYPILNTYKIDNNKEDVSHMKS